MQGWKNAGKGLLQANLKNHGRDRGVSRGSWAGQLGDALFMSISKDSLRSLAVCLPLRAPSLKPPYPREATHG